jgi:putative SOS response-associated peptidase YedK
VIDRGFAPPLSPGHTFGMQVLKSCGRPVVKAHGSVHAPPLGLSITLWCGSTGFNEHDGRRQPPRSGRTPETATMGPVIDRWIVERTIPERPMCGRFTQRKPLRDVAVQFDATFDEFVEHVRPNFNAAPSQSIAAVRLEADGRHIRMFRWGLIPSWAKDLGEGFKHFNARGETAYKLPSYRSAFAKRRCLVIADGFFEWEKQGKAKIPHHFQVRGGATFGFAGLWEQWQGDSSSIESCTIITTEPNELVRPIHNRMPVILSTDRYARWLDPQTPVPELQSLLVPYSADLMESSLANPIVNNVRRPWLSR